MFAFSDNFGDDVITDISLNDAIDVSATGVFDISGLTIVQDGADAVITSASFTGTSSIRLTDVSADSLSADQFIFATSGGSISVGDTQDVGMNFVSDFSEATAKQGDVQTSTLSAIDLSGLYSEFDFDAFDLSVAINDLHEDFGLF